MDNVKVASRQKIHVSAGAVVVRPTEFGREVLLLYRKNTDSWHLPKGTMRPNESVLETALREVKEETGFEIMIEKHLGVLPSTKEDGTSKITHYYLASVIDGLSEPHDSEHDRVEFFPLAEAYHKLRAKSIFEKEYVILDKYLK